MGIESFLQQIKSGCELSNSLLPLSESAVEHLVDVLQRVLLLHRLFTISFDVLRLLERFRRNSFEFVFILCFDALDYTLFVVDGLPKLCQLLRKLKLSIVKAGLQFLHGCVLFVFSELQLGL